MPQDTKIEWTDATWNPWSGCTKISPGCDNCYAHTIAEGRRGTPAFPYGFDLTIRAHKFKDPLKWKTPRRVFVNSMSDLFLGSVPEEDLVQVWRTMLEADWHEYQILTKRPIPMARKIHDLKLELPPHIWLGVSVESQEWADQRIPVLLQVPAKVRFLSCEPLLGPVDLTVFLECVATEHHSLDVPCDVPIHWVIDGGESGPGRRLAWPSWFRSIRDQCQAAGVSYFHKQGNAHRSGKDRILDGRTWDEYPTIMDKASRRSEARLDKA